MAAIEPLSAAMTYTAQQVERPQAAEKHSANAMEGQPVEVNAPQVDAETLSVAKTQTDGDSKREGEPGEQRQQQAQQVQQMSDETIRRALKELTNKQANFQSQFGIHEGTDRLMIKIVDKKTKDVIKEFPSEKMLDMIAKVWEYSGLVVDEKR